MQVWAILYNPTLFSEDLYQRGLQIVDSDSAARIKRFYRREDACRTLIGRLLARTMLRQRGVLPAQMIFGATESGKPYVKTAGLEPPIAFNVTHDNGLIAIAFAPGVHGAPVYNIGIDVMKVAIPSRDTFVSFVNTVRDQLTPFEHRCLFEVGQDEGLRRFFWMWTLKEAYTKALGIGLGFDFRRVEFDPEENIVRVDGEIPPGWKFSKFILNDGKDFYEGVVAEYVGGLQTEVIPESAPVPWLVPHEAVVFVEKAIGILTEVKEEASCSVSNVQ